MRHQCPDCHQNCDCDCEDVDDCTHFMELDCPGVVGRNDSESKFVWSEDYEESDKYDLGGEG